MLEQLFGSKARVKLLQVFLNNPDQPFFLRQLAREMKLQLNGVRREVQNLVDIGIVVEVDPQKVNVSGDSIDAGTRKFFMANTNFLLFPELKNLLIKADLMLERNFIDRLVRLPKLKLLVVTGVFVGEERAPTDLLLVGMINKLALSRLIASFEKALLHQINYTVLSPHEYLYRQQITDRFLYSILSGKKIIVIDKLSS